MSEKLNEAIFFAAKAHGSQCRKMEKIPYILHSMEVAAIIGSMTTDEDVMMAGLLHDVIEDTAFSYEEISEHFGKRVADLVASETEDKHKDRPATETWKQRKEESIAVLRDTADENVRILWLADKLSNMRSLYRNWMKKGDAVFDAFHQKDKNEHGWYYRTIGSYVATLDQTAAYQEYNQLVNAVFGGKEVAL